MTSVTPHAFAQRRRVLFTMLTTLGFRYPPGSEPAVIAGIRQYLGGWVGIGRIEAGMARQGFDLELTPYDAQGWRATFYPEGRIHSATLAVERHRFADRYSHTAPVARLLHWFLPPLSACSGITDGKHWQARDVGHVTVAAPALDVLAEGDARRPDRDLSRRRAQSRAVRGRPHRGKPRRLRRLRRRAAHPAGTTLAFEVELLWLNP
jgi:hypothetical protein